MVDILLEEQLREKQSGHTNTFTDDIVLGMTLETIVAGKSYITHLIVVNVK